MKTIEEIDARIKMARVRLKNLENDKSRAAVYERDMYENDISLLTKMAEKLKNTQKEPV